MSRFRVWVEVDFEVEAENVEAARGQAMHDLAFGLASMDEAYVTNVEPLPFGDQEGSAT